MYIEIRKAKNLFRGFVFYVLLTAVVISNSQPASAAIITIDLTAEIAEVDDLGGLLEGLVNVGDIITGSYTFDSATPDSSTVDGIGQYAHFTQPYGVTLSAGGFVFQTDPDNINFIIGILNNHNGRDSYAFGSYNNLPLSNGVGIDHISWQLDDYSCTALSSDALPTTPPVLGDWQSIGGITINFGPKGSSIMRAHVTSAVPEPGTVFLLGLGGLALIRKRRG